jgi:tRNA(Ile)-lysidine synthase TilS/MesJ
MREINIYRPLLRYEKNFLELYCVKNNIPYSIDATNFDEKYLRNSIRSRIVSKLKLEEKNEFLKLIDRQNSKLQKVYKQFENNVLGNEAIIFTIFLGFLLNVDVINQYVNAEKIKPII